MAGFVRDMLAGLAHAGGRDGPGAEHHRLLVRLDRRLAGLVRGGSGAEGETIRLRPGDCSAWSGDPRGRPAHSAESCRALIDSIADAGGNRIPVLVRANPPGSAQPWELLVGGRRHFAVDWLNHNGRPELRLKALAVALCDEEAFRLADIENREREDIAELDRARSYQAALDRFYGGVQTRMAEALGLSNSQLSRLLSLAQLPGEVVDAFATREEIRVRHSEVLTPLLRRADAGERLLAAARDIGGEQQALARDGGQLLSAATVLARLRDAAAGLPRDHAVVAGGTRVGQVRPGRGGALLIDLALAEDADIDALLSALRATLLAAREDQ